MIKLPTVKDIRAEFKRLLQEKKFVKDKSGVDLLEITGVTFIADEENIFGKVAGDYKEREIEWYKSQSLNVNNIPAPVPKIWKMVATPAGFINSNYGYLIWSQQNGYQYEHALNALLSDRSTRRSIMIYTRPSMQTDYNKDGMSDFCCTNSVGYFIRDNKLHAFVNMRANDARHGFPSDRHWQQHVLQQLVKDYNVHKKAKEDFVIIGDIHWNASSLHLYQPHWNLIA